MQCICTPSERFCPPSGIKTCDPGVSHCLLSLKWNSNLNKYVEHIQDCWQWADRAKCPNDVGKCYLLLQPDDKYKSCCCKGPLCNNVTGIEFSLPPAHEAPYQLTTDAVGIASSRDDSYGKSTQSSILREYSIVIIIIPIVLLVLLLLLGLLFFRIYMNRWPTLHIKQRRKQIRGDRFCECQSARLTSGDGAVHCTCGNLNKAHGLEVFGGHLDYNGPSSLKIPAVGVGWLTNDEVEGLASKIVKVELRSQGCFGQVWHGRCTVDSSTSHFVSLPQSDSDGLVSKPSAIDVAIKIFRSSQKDSWEAELALFRLPGLAHPNIVKFYGADQVTVDPSDHELEYWLVLEYHPLGSLHDYLISHTITWLELLHIAIGVARGLSHLHSEFASIGGTESFTGHPKPSVAHRDLNSRNILLKSDMSTCIADFGLAIRFEPGQFPSIAHPQLGTRRYMAPEVLDGAIQFSRDAYLRIDVYAMGLVIWELMSRCTGTDGDPIKVESKYFAPYELELGPAPTMEELQRFVALEKRRPQFSSAWRSNRNMCSLWETVEECWDQDAEARLSAGCVSERLLNLSRHSPSDRRVNAECMLPMPNAIPLQPLYTPVPETVSSKPLSCPSTAYTSCVSPKFAMPVTRNAQTVPEIPTTVCFPVPSKSIASINGGLKGNRNTPGEFSPSGGDTHRCEVDMLTQPNRLC
ncbi:unnamed protein product [Calicophoron daubneyi]|uniref:receptor protein serine/threonine kinase n=1 Tax=Calicophoron daubneyi TaxID=300641 RepID=A0AAV2T380_CALDB